MVKVSVSGNVAVTDKPPVGKNEYVELHIDGLSHEGLGVGKYKGFTLFVKRALPGETVRAKVVKLKKQYGYARLMEILKPSPARVTPPCSIYKYCGGCQLQHLSYEEQLRQKRQIVMDNLERIGGLDLDNIIVHPTLGMETPWRYRNKAQVPIGERDGGLIGGFYRQGSHEIIDMQECLIQHEANDQVIQKVKEIAGSLGIPAYDELEHKGLLRHVVAKYGFATDQLMVVLVTNGRTIPRQAELIEELTRSFPNLKSIVQNVNTRRTNVIFGEETKVLWGDSYIYDQIGDIRFAISPQSFYQVNPVQTKVLYDTALAYANLQGEETVIDAYCGIGTISLFLAQKARKVFGVEVVPQAIEDAKRNARLNHITNVEFVLGEAETIIPEWKAQGMTADVICVDPPRKGCDPALLEAIIAMRPKRVVYVSCNPSTLARDLNILTEGGYEVQEVQPVDMFPQTAHVETVVLMSRL